MRTRVVIYALLVLASGSAYSSQTTDRYRCTIERFTQAQGDDVPSYTMLKEAAIGKQFTIDRSSGVTAGALRNSTDAKPFVIDRGDNGNSFKAVSMVSTSQGLPGTTVTALNVMEFLDGERKPFNYMINDAVFFGTCESF
ncbi:hypothetical protein [Pseudomonas aeruginosa]|uniref:hypothetical protein n=1 Tax=Pseudomonas aeruginosa TaxID=287 RepID=UPI002A69C97A|nr:hypothetical protein [Pseudomonas aeruginosa]MDY1103254.1 hypothetical protein [Pseudomonas aeruginosa]